MQQIGRRWARQVLAATEDGRPLPVATPSEAGLTTDGEELVAIHTGGMFFHQAHPDEQQRAVAGFGAFLSALRTPVQLLVRSRRVPGDGGGAGGRTAEFVASWLADNPTHRRDTFVLLRATGPVARRGAGRAVSAEQAAMTAAQALERAGLRPRRLTPAELRALLVEAGYREDHDRSLVIDCRESVTRCRVAGEMRQTLVLDQLPGVELTPGWLADLLTAPIEYDLSMHIAPEDSTAMIRFLGRQLRNLQSTRMLESERDSVADVYVQESLPEVSDLRASLARGEEKTFRAGVYLTLRAETAPELDEAARHVSVLGEERLARLIPAHFQARDGMASTLPIVIDRLRRTHLLTTTSASTLFPWVTDDLWHESGLLCGVNRVSGGLVRFDPFLTTTFQNANVGVLAQSGGGKTYLASTIATAAFERGVEVLVIDPESEYRVIAERIGGQHIEIGPRSEVALNLLDLLDRPDDLEAAVADVLDIVSAIGEGLSAEERVMVEALLRRLAANPPERPLRLTHLVGLMGQEDSLVRVRRLLFRWTEGALGDLFDRASTANLDTGFTVFGVRDLREDVVAPAYSIITAWLWNRIISDPRPRLLVVDELGALFEDPAVRRFAVRVARRIRKYGGGLVFCTQNGADLLGNDAGRAIANNAAVVFLGMQRGLEARPLAEAFELTPAQQKSLEVASRGEFLAIAGRQRFPLAVMAAPWQREMIEAARPHQPGSAVTIAE
ncbi:MAG: VirB4 family type IV secretion system protein [Candidatus Dormibacteria bacterium]